MALLRRFIRRAHLLLYIEVVAGPAAAGSPDPNTLRDQLEDQVLAGDIDGEDLAVLRGPREHQRSRRGGLTYVGVSAFIGDRRDGRREYGGFVVLQVPFEHWLRSPSPSHAVGQKAKLPDPAPLDRGSRSTLLLPGAIHETGSNQVERAGPTATIVVTAEVARACVRAAWRTLAIADDASIDSMGTRARVSGAVPELRLR